VGASGAASDVPSAIGAGDSTSGDSTSDASSAARL
jgi:hypothetical protein